MDRTIKPWDQTPSDFASLRKVQYLTQSDYQVSDVDFYKQEELPVASIVKPWREDYERQQEWRMTIDPRKGFSSQPRDQLVRSPDYSTMVAQGPGVPLQALEHAFTKVVDLKQRVITAPAIRGACRIAFQKN